MKYLLVIAVIALVLWLARSGRRVPPPATPAKPSGAKDIVACAHCGLHLPRDEALPGRGGVFCGEDHRHAYERAHPGS